MAAVVKSVALAGRPTTPDRVHEVLGRSMLVDGLDIVLDLTRSGGSYLVDAITGRRYLDMFTFVASSALGMNPPALVDDREFHAELMQAALNKPSNSDVYSVAMARFVETFARVLGDPALPHLFFVEGGALAVGAQSRVRLEESAQPSPWDRPGAGHSSAPPARGISRPQRLYPVADQHQADHYRPVPEIRLATHRCAVHAARPG